MGADAADLVFTGPPYNVDCAGYTDDQLKIKDDRMSAGDFKQFLEAAFRSYRSFFKAGALLSFVTRHRGGRRLRMRWSREASGKKYICLGVRPVYVSARTHVLLPRNRREGSWYGDKSQSTLWLEEKPAANRIHPTAKPVELI